MADHILSEIITLSGAGFNANDIQGVLWLKHSTDVAENEIRDVLNEYHASFDDYDTY